MLAVTWIEVGWSLLIGVGIIGGILYAVFGGWPPDQPTTYF